jgi:hypothetical protein
LILEAAAVCQSLRKTCLQRTIFWTNIVITNLTTAGQLQIMLGRSGETVLSIPLYAQSYIKYDILDQLKQRRVMCQWKFLVIKFGPNPALTHLSSDGEGFDGKEFSALERFVAPYPYSCIHQRTEQAE